MNFVNEIGEPRQTFLSGLAAAQILEQGGERLRVGLDQTQEPIFRARPQHYSLFTSFAPRDAMRIGKHRKHHAAVEGGRDLLAANRCPGGVQRMQPNPTPPLRSRPSP